MPKPKTVNYRLKEYEDEQGYFYKFKHTDRQDCEKCCRPFWCCAVGMKTCIPDIEVENGSNHDFGTGYFYLIKNKGTGA